jgi:membrane protein YqaA with SNARE-associated domain
VAAVAEPDSETSAAAVRGELIALIMRFLGGLVIVSVLMATLGYLAREPAQALARAFVAKLGLAGLALGSLLADGLMFPVPPQFYMLLSVASGMPSLPTFAAICGGSVVAGCLGYALAQLASRLTWVARATERHRDVLSRVFSLYGYKAALVASLLPIPYSVLCQAAGVNRLPRRFLALLSLCRIPKLLGFYWLVRAGWSLVT